MAFSLTKNCLFLALAISPVASAQIVTESFETTTDPTPNIRYQPQSSTDLLQNHLDKAQELYDLLSEWRQRPTSSFSAIHN
jgi:hypothetical protein